MVGVISPLVVVGCGPAGLAAAHAYLRAGGRELLVLEAGGPVQERRRADPGDIVRGVGGAGLMSDGKFSFYPAATALWSLPAGESLRAAGVWTRELLSRFGLEAPEFLERPPPRTPGSDGFKPYPSTYMDLERRTQLIEALYAPLADRVELHTRLERIEWDGRLLQLTARGPRGPRTLRCHRLIGAGGRFFPLLLAEQGLIPQTFRRLELGVRIEGPADHPFFLDLVREGRSIDPKLILEGEAGVEWRTFCFCTRGEIVETEDYGLRTLSGRSDCPPTQRSNVGFNVRFRHRDAAAGVNLERARAHGPFALPLAEALAGAASLEAFLGPRAAEALQRGLARLGARVPALLQDRDAFVVRGPTIEGVGDYPACDENLVAPGLPIQWAGDCGGVFRGIVAALVSGAYAGGQAAELPARSKRQAVQPLAGGD